MQLRKELCDRVFGVELLRGEVQDGGDFLGLAFLCSTRRKMSEKRVTRGGRRGRTGEFDKYSSDVRYVGRVPRRPVVHLDLLPLRRLPRRIQQHIDGALSVTLRLAIEYRHPQNASLPAVLQAKKDLVFPSQLRVAVGVRRIGVVEGCIAGGRGLAVEDVVG